MMIFTRIHEHKAILSILKIPPNHSLMRLSYIKCVYSSAKCITVNSFVFMDSSKDHHMLGVFF